MGFGILLGQPSEWHQVRLARRIDIAFSLRIRILDGAIVMQNRSANWTRVIGSLID
jgi:hypothetical protein